MRRIEVGQRLKTNYGTDVYVVRTIDRGCTCHAPLDFSERGPRMPEHIHLYLRTVSESHNKGSEAWLGWYDEKTLKSVIPRDRDRIILVENPAPIQTTLAFSS